MVSSLMMHYFRVRNGNTKFREFFFTSIQTKSLTIAVRWRWRSCARGDVFWNPQNYNELVTKSENHHSNSILFIGLFVGNIHVNRHGILRGWSNWGCTYKQFSNISMGTCLYWFQKHGVVIDFVNLRYTIYMQYTYNTRIDSNMNYYYYD